MPKRSTRTRMDDQREDCIDPKGPNHKNLPKKLQTHNMFTDDVENINSSNKGRDLELANNRNRKDAANFPEAQQSYFTYRENYENQESGIDSRGEKIC